jgi:hypothetical protein
MVAGIVIVFIIFGVFLSLYWNKLYFTDYCSVLQTIKLDDIIIEIVDDGCKEGLPHTTGPNTVRMTRSIWEGPRRDSVLRHERVHLLQKGRDSEKWLEFYEREWGYKCSALPPAGIPAELVARRRPNPDTDACAWATWRNRYVFFPVFGDDNSLRNAPVLVWDLAQGRLTKIPDEWRTEFCGTGACAHQYEHPHEISAEWLTDGSSKVKTPAAYKLFAWNK